MARFAALLRHLVQLIALLSAAWLAALPAHAAFEAPPLRLDGSRQQSLDGHFSVFHDPAGTLALAQVAGEGTPFEASPAPSPSFGYHSGTIWVRLQIENPLPTPQYVWLENDWPFKDFVDAYRIDRFGQIRHMRSGAAIPAEERPLQSRAILFPVGLAAGESTTLYLAFSGLAATTLRLSVWQPSAYADARAMHSALKYFGLGSILLVIVFSILAAQASHRPALLMGGISDALHFPVFLGLDGFFFDFLPAGPEMYPMRLINLLGGLLFFTHVQFARALLDIRRIAPRLDKALLWFTALFLGLVLFSSATAKLNLLAGPGAAMLLVMLCVSIYAAVRGDTIARIYLLSWGILWITFFMRTAQLSGWVHIIPNANDLPIFGVIGSALVLTYALYLIIRKSRQDADRMQTELSAQQASENARLQAAVHEKTRALQEAMALAEKSSQAKSGFLSMMSHELRAPLHTVLGYSQLLAREAYGDTRGKIEVIEESGRQLLRLINDVLQFSRGEIAAIALSPQPLSLRQLADQLIAGNRLAAEQQGNRLVAAIDPALPAWIEADEQRLRQVLQNLIVNACKYTEGGRIELRIETARPAPTHPQHCRIRFAVADTGPGIPEHAHQTVFEPFSRLGDSAHKPGVGLGLSIVSQLVAAMGGEVALESRCAPAENTGSVFSFELVLPLSAAIDTPAQTALIVGHRGRQRTLLVIDDSEQNRLFLHETCTRWGFQVELAADGEAALSILDSGKTIDGVLADQFMPVLDGWGFLKRLRENPSQAAIKVVLVSAAEPLRPEHIPPTLRFDAVLMKPFPTEQLADILARLLGVEWVRQEPLEQPLEADSPPDLGILSAEDRARFRHMVKLGQIVGIQQWLDELSRQYPQGDATFRQIHRLCEQVDLPALTRLAHADENTALPGPD